LQLEQVFVEGSLIVYALLFGIALLGVVTFISTIFESDRRRL
jgi:hypothetical protein